MTITTFPTTATFASSQESPGSPGYPERNGQTVTVIRALTDKEADLEEVGPMFKIKFADGIVTDAFADELTPAS